MKKRWQKFRASEQQYHDFSADFLGHSGDAIVPDDKRKKFAWILNCSSYLFLMCSFAWMTSTWTHHNMLPAEANAWLCKLLLALLGDELAKKTPYFCFYRPVALHVRDHQAKMLER